MKSMRLADTGAIIPAAGRGKRMGGQGNKVFLELAGTPVLILALKPFEQCQWIREIVIAADATEIEEIKTLVQKYRITKVARIVAGGIERQDSVYHGLMALNQDIPRVVVHDGARPLLTLGQLDRFIEQAQRHQAAIMAVPLKDTIKEIDHGGWVTVTPPREMFRAIQTPQVFDRAILEKMHKLALSEKRYATDDAALLETQGIPVKILEGSYENIKVTTPEDLLFAQVILQNRRGG